MTKIIHLSRRIIKRKSLKMKQKIQASKVLTALLYRLQKFMIKSMQLSYKKINLASKALTALHSRVLQAIVVKKDVKI